MKKNINILMGAILLLLAGCSEFIEPSIENRKIEVLAPANKLETNSYQQTFWWNPMADALFYRLQVVSPKFDSVSKLVLDTLITKEKFVYTMDPGKYEWRVRGENGSSVSDYTKRSLVIFPSSLTEQSVQLTVPSSGLYFSKPEIRYEWLKLFGATVYRLQVDNNNFLDEKNMTLNITTSNLGFLQTLSQEGTYQFRVRAENATENSKWSTVRTFSYDATGPEKVSLSSPINKQLVSRPVRLVWNRMADAERYEVSVYKSDEQTPYSKSYPQIVTSTEHVFDAGEIGETIAWRVRAFDKAGNAGAYSEIRTFTIQ
ncbi:hypothetical protein DBR40_00970 [Pedobacter sp. KBW01]|uniref:hypothetical protein n=1 Tax=Pedobacter sp. KBW01 TaxID=2153364 RepID=UPI000F5ADABF|nr:hypothetical protein [Pedobacter sp. KBW01]RQO80221.1 hypothetical protein DBR40_00970 [Pedobacter sp. KBW01]